MIHRSGPRLLWPSAALLLLVLASCRCPDDRRGVRRAEQKAEAQRLAAQSRLLERQIDGLETVRRVLRWYELTGREPGRMGALLPGMVGSVTFDQLFALRRLENSPGLDERGRRRLRYLRNHLTDLLLERRAGAAEDRWVALVGRETVQVSGVEQRIRFNDLLSVMTGEPVRQRRREITAVRVPVLRRLDGVFRDWRRKLRQEARRLGVSYFAVREEREEWDTHGLLLAAATQNRESEDRFKQAWSALVLPVVPSGQRPTLADLRFVLQGATQQPTLDEALLLPALRRALTGLGIELRDGASRPLAISDQGLLTTAAPVDPPRDVRLAFHLGSGLEDHVRLFEAGGRAVCRAATREQDWVFRRLGPHVGARAFGYLMGLLWLEPEWWSRYQQLRGGAGPSQEQVEDLMRIAVLAALVRLRVQGVVVPILRAVLEGGPARVYDSLWKEEVSGSATGLFGGLMHAQVGLELDPGEQLGYLDELGQLDDPFDLRAYALAFQLREALRRRYGPRWFEHDDAGPRLLNRLCDAGSAVPPDHLAEQLGLKQLDLGAPWRGLMACWDRLNTKP
jgi:hypothetical protein